MSDQEQVRIDKWLWAVRLYKTRTLAADACRKGNVRIEGRRVKPSRLLRGEETVTARSGTLTRTVKVIGLIERRVGASVAREYLEDHTPASEYEKLKEQRAASAESRAKGAGRPTKKQRRVLERHGWC